MPEHDTTLLIRLPSERRYDTLATLKHYGVPGMKWGVRKDRLSDFKVKSGRLDSFGSDGHNILYITGISGSGKSTLALKLADKLNAEPIHLDWYYDGRATQSTPFSKFLESNGVNLKNVYKDGKLNYEESDKIFPLMKKYSEDHKLIAEGVQLLDETMSSTMRSELSHEPVISVQTSAKVAFNRAAERDQVAMDYVNFQKAKKLQDLFDNDVSLSIGEAYAESLLEEST